MRRAQRARVAGQRAWVARKLEPAVHRLVRTAGGPAGAARRRVPAGPAAAPAARRATPGPPAARRATPEPLASASHRARAKIWRRALQRHQHRPHRRFRFIRLRTSRLAPAERLRPLLRRSRARHETRQLPSLEELRALLRQHSRGAWRTRRGPRPSGLSLRGLLERQIRAPSGARTPDAFFIFRVHKRSAGDRDGSRGRSGWVTALAIAGVLRDQLCRRQLRSSDKFRITNANTHDTWRVSDPIEDAVQTTSSRST